VSILAYSLDDDPELVDYYLGPGFLPFDRTYIYPGEAGSLRVIVVYRRDLTAAGAPGASPFAFFGPPLPAPTV
jgi:hypothetical protein